MVAKIHLHDNKKTKEKSVKGFRICRPPFFLNRLLRTVRRFPIFFSGIIYHRMVPIGGWEPKDRSKRGSGRFRVRIIAAAKEGSLGAVLVCFRIQSACGRGGVSAAIRGLRFRFREKPVFGGCRRKAR